MKNIMNFIFLFLLMMSTSVAQDRTFYIDAGKILLNTTTITEEEIENATGTTGNIQDQLDDKASSASVALKADDNAVVHLTGNESISGTKTYTGKTVATSTTNGFHPCPAMTETQRNAIVGPASGDCIYNSTSNSLNVYNGSLWKTAGGGLSDWVTSFAYAIGDIVVESSKIYQALTAHTSGTFATDLAALKWNELSPSSTGIISLANGGTNKAITASNGAIPYSDADSFEMLAPGTSGQVLQTNGAGAPSFVNKSISGKAQNETAVTVEEIQFPNSSLTLTATGKYLAETGDNNLLANANFEHSTYSTSWTIGTGTPAAESSTVVSGTQALKVTYSAATASIIQDSTRYAAQLADGVDGAVWVRVKTAISGIQVCSRNAGTTSTTNCVSVDSNNKWGIYIVPSIMGATSNGIFIGSTANVTGDLYVDNAFVGMADLKQHTKACIAADCTTEFSAKVSAADATSAENVEFITGNCTDATAGEATCPFTAGLFSSTPNCTATWDDTVSGGRSIQILAKSTTSVTVNITVSSNGTAANEGFTLNCQRQGTDYIAAKNIENGNIFVAQCGANCAETFTATVAANGTISDESPTGWINGNCTNADPRVCTYDTSLITEAMACTGDNENITAYTSTTSFSVDNNAQITKVTCNKVGADRRLSRLITGSFREMMSVSGQAGPAIASVSVSAAEALTENESSFVSSCTNADPAVCTLTAGFFIDDPKCWANPIVAATISIVTGDTTSTVTIDRTDASTAFTLFCQGDRK